MALETVAVKTATDAATQAVRAADSALKKFWSVLDAAAEKTPPSETMTQKGIQSMQGQGS